MTVPDERLFALIVEDEPDSAEIVTRILDFYKRSYRCVVSAEEAVAFLAVQRPQIIIADLALPKMTGWDLLHYIRTTPQLAYLPVIAVTAHYSPRVAREGKDLGFDAMLPKPFDTRSFIEELDRLVEHASQD